MYGLKPVVEFMTFNFAMQVGESILLLMGATQNSTCVFVCLFLLSHYISYSHSFLLKSELLRRESENWISSSW